VISVASLSASSPLVVGCVNTWRHSCVELKQQYARDWAWQFNTGNKKQQISCLHLL